MSGSSVKFGERDNARNMRMRLQIVLMLTASTTLATSFALHPLVVWAAESDSAAPAAMIAAKIGTTEDHGRTIYINEEGAAAAKEEVPAPKRSGFVYWSSKESRWKPVPSANTASMKAARSAAAEVSEYYGRESVQSANAKILAANSHGHAASAGEIDQSIVMAAARHNVDPNLVRAVVKVESNFNSNAVSRKGAMGLMQLMPQTARELKVKNPFDAQQNVDAGVRHLKQLLDNYNGDVNLTLAAYNAGSGAVRRSAGVPHYSETQNYVRRITNLYYGGADFSQTGASRDPVHVQRDARGVLYISNTD